VPRLFVMARLRFIAHFVFSVSILTGCQTPGVTGKTAPAASSHQARVFEREDANVPFLAVRLYYGDAAAVRGMLEVQDDSAVKFRGMRRAGNGIVSVGVKDGKGAWVESYECGGHLFVTGAEGQPCQIVVRNESKSRLEILVGMDGADAISGCAFKLENHGLVLSPLQTSTIGVVKRGKPPVLRFGPGRAPSLGPVIEARIAPARGSILLAVFQEKGRFPWEGSIRAATRNAPGKYPQRKFEPEPVANEYR
jgi:hypothetical protein